MVHVGASRATTRRTPPAQIDGRYRTDAERNFVG